nr:MAG TPA: hypothetical protein [Caudoviricetes sp.]
MYIINHIVFLVNTFMYILFCALLNIYFFIYYRKE